MLLDVGKVDDVLVADQAFCRFGRLGACGVDGDWAQPATGATDAAMAISLSFFIMGDLLRSGFTTQ
jgi:hypothetical protein